MQKGGVRFNCFNSFLVWSSSFSLSIVAREETPHVIPLEAPSAAWKGEMNLIPKPAQKQGVLHGPLEPLITSAPMPPQP